MAKIDGLNIAVVPMSSQTDAQLLIVFRGRKYFKAASESPNSPAFGNEDCLGGNQTSDQDEEVPGLVVH